MNRLAIKGGQVVTPHEQRFTDVNVEGATIANLGSSAGPTVEVVEIDARGCWVTPGLIDLQVNGTKNCNLWADPSAQNLARLMDEMAKAGVTTFLPTLITDDLDHLRQNIDFLERDMHVGKRQLEADFEVQSLQIAAKQARPAAAAKSAKASTVRMPGIHLEGPCLSPDKPGVHPTQHLQPLNLDILKRLKSDAVCLMTLAPELDPSGKAVAYLQEHNVVVSLGHSNSSFEQAQAAFNANVHLMTHTFNALPAIHHRNPGAVAAALLDERVYCCLICDGDHLSVPAVALVLKTKGLARTILVTDVAPVGTSEGGRSGSSILLDQALRNVVKWGLADFPSAIGMATFNPAKAMNWQEKIGSIAAGKNADLVIWDKATLGIKHVIVAGRLLF